MLNILLNQSALKVTLADDDADDCFFFEKAMREIPLEKHLTIHRDGEALMNGLMTNSGSLPDIIFLDLSMPRKTGFECLMEMKENANLTGIFVTLLSTSFPRDTKYERDLIKTLKSIGANNFIRKPKDFQELKQLIHEDLIKISKLKAYSIGGKPN